jgi:hypothetical protein
MWIELSILMASHMPVRRREVKVGQRSWTGHYLIQDLNP